MILIFFTSCIKDDYITQTYDKDLVKEQFTCLKLHLSPYSSKTINTAKSLYTFNDNCQNTLEIKYKSKIACNSKHNTNKQFNSFIQLSILKDNKLIYVVYKDLKDDVNINEEIKKGYKKLCQTINL
ncbi:MAG TPA: hypothetical protein EYG97_01350 [Arcobacter sp.]|nr:hypothetical protein [Arcobacter sp.]HIP55651.1 hypothetical protein [Arcobacter sp.]